jgi:hypothetical protein
MLAISSRCSSSSVCAQRRPADAVQFAEVVDVFTRGQPRIQSETVWQHAQPALRPLRGCHRIDVVHADAACIGFHDAIQHAQRCGFSGAVWPEQSGDRSVARLEPDIVDRLH